MMDMKAQTKWGWDHAIYLFLGGMGAGAYIVGAMAGFAGEDWMGISRTGVIFGVISLAVGYLILLFSLGKPANAIHAMKKPGTAWISRGVIIVTLFIIFAGIHWLFGAILGILPAGLVKLLSILGIITGFGVMMYTGFLLAANRPIAFWANPLLPLVFLLNALYSGVCSVLLLGSIFASGSVDQLGSIALFAIYLSILLMFAMAFYIWGSHREPEGRAAMEMAMTGKYAGMFWGGVMVVGLLIPLVLELINFSSGGGNIALHIVSGLAGMIGMFLMRQVILACGVYARLRATRFEYVLPHV